MSFNQKISATLGVITALGVAAIVARKNQFPERLWNDHGSIALNRQQITLDELNLISSFFANREDRLRTIVSYGIDSRANETQITAQFQNIKIFGDRQYVGNFEGKDVCLVEEKNGMQAVFFHEKYKNPTQDDPVIYFGINIPNSEWEKDRGKEFLDLAIPEVLKEVNLAQGNRRQKLEEYILDKTKNESNHHNR